MYRSLDYYTGSRQVAIVVKIGEIAKKWVKTIVVKHLIVFNVADGVAEEDCLRMARQAQEELTRIPGVTGVSFGVAVSGNAAYKYLLIVDFAGEEVIDFYRDHPIHVRFANEVFRPMAVHRITTDFHMLIQ